MVINRAYMRTSREETQKQKFRRFSMSTRNVAIEGCCHGDLDRIYEVLENIESNRNVSTDFMICCGDFQAIRTEYAYKFGIFPFYL